MPFNLLLLPLLGGFLFVRYWNPTRYHALRAEKERLIILAALAGLASLILAFAIVKTKAAFYPCQPDHFCLSQWWKDNIPFDHAGTSLLAFSLGAVCWYPLNWVCKRGKAIDRVIEEDKVPFELLLKKAQDQAKTISVTMKNGKVYVGFVIHILNPALPTRFIQILPTKSGYRDEKTRWLVFTTPYAEALDKVDRDYDEKAAQLDEATEKLDIAEAEYELKKNKETQKLIDHLKKVINELYAELDRLTDVADDFGIVLPVSEIVSINIYSAFIHAQYFPPAPNKN
jgi:hypothetical protein